MRKDEFLALGEFCVYHNVPRKGDVPLGVGMGGFVGVSECFSGGGGAGTLKIPTPKKSRFFLAL